MRSPPAIQPTDQQTKLKYLIDFCITKGISENYMECKDSLELSSDHTPVFVTLTCEIKNKPSKCVLHSGKTDWIYFRAVLNSSLQIKIALKTEVDIETAVEHFNLTVQKAAWESTPPHKIIDNKLTFPVTILAKVSEKRQLRRQWQLTWCSKVKTCLNKITKELKTTPQRQ